MNPGLILLLLFVSIPLVELYFLIEVGSEIGAIPTILLTVFTAVLGGLLVRLQGFSTAMRVHRAMDQGEVPAIEMMEGVILLIAGLMLLLPGFFTDALGFLALVPPLRRRVLVAYLARAGVMQQARQPDTSEAQPGSRRVIEGEFQREEDETR